MSPWMMVASVNLNFAWIGDHSSDAIPWYATLGTKWRSLPNWLNGSSSRNAIGVRVTRTSRPKSSDG